MKHPANNEAAVVGSGPNGLAAAIKLAQAGFRVTVFEKSDVPGGACRSAELIKPGTVHDVGSAVHPLAVNSPFFRTLPLENHGLKWVYPELSLAHPLDDGSAAALAIDLDRTGETLDPADRKTYKNHMDFLVKQSDELINEVMHFPKLPLRHPLLMLRFGLQAMYSTKSYTRQHFRGSRAKALFAGLGVHSVISPGSPGSIAAGLVLGAAAHVTGWAYPEGGARKLTDALAGYLKELGATVTTGHEITDLDELQSFGQVYLDITPEQFIKIAGSTLPDGYLKKLTSYRYGPGVFKVDWILDGPVPWQAEACRRSGTVHVGGSREEIIASETEVMRGRHAEKPFVLVSQPSIFDTTRAPKNEHVLWGYCHVPAGSTKDMTGAIEGQIERFAPGFKDRIIARRVMNTADFETDNPNCVKGDITGGSQSLRKLVLPPVGSVTPLDNVFLCSSSTPPGPGVHGMCGVRAVESALKIQGLS